MSKLKLHIMPGSVIITTIHCSCIEVEKKVSAVLACSGRTQLDPAYGLPCHSSIIMDSIPGLFRVTNSYLA